MKKIEIFQCQCDAVTLYDDSDEDLTTYSNKVTQIMELSNITTITTSRGTCIVRPSKIASIKVTNVDEVSSEIENKDDDVIISD